MNIPSMHAGLEHDCIQAIYHQLTELEQFSSELKHLLDRHAETLAQEGLLSRVERLERWTDCYARGLKAAASMAEAGPAWLGELRGRLRLAVEELQRLEDEGGCPAGREQAVQAEEFLKAARRLDRIIPAIERIVEPAVPDHVHDMHELREYEPQ